MNIKNYCEDDNKNKPYRILITGCSGSGKSNLLLNLIYDILEFDKLYFCAKDLNESKYEKLIKNYTKYNDIDINEINKFKKYKKLLLKDYNKYKKEIFTCNVKTI